MIDSNLGRVSRASILLPWMMSGAPLLPGALGPLASRCVHRLSCAALRLLASRSLSCVVRLASGGAGVGGGEGIGPIHRSPIAEEEEEGLPLILQIAITSVFYSISLFIAISTLFT